MVSSINTKDKIIIFLIALILLFYSLKPTYAEINKVGELPPHNGGYGTAVYANGVTYYFGGHYTDTSTNIALDDILAIDSNYNVTELTAKLPNPIYESTGALGANGKIYLFGGRNNYSNIALQDIVEFDPINQVATKLSTTLPTGRSMSVAVAATNDKIYVFGGFNNAANQYGCKDILEFDPYSKTIVKLTTELPIDLSGIAGALGPNGKIYLFGGFTSPSDRTDIIIEFDPITKTLKTLNTKLPYESYGISAITRNGLIYLVGGTDFSKTGGRTDQILIFDPETYDISTAEERLPKPRSFVSTVLNENNEILAIGGSVSGSPSVNNDILVLFPHQENIQAPVLNGVIQDDKNAVLTWDQINNATNYILEKSTDGVNFSPLKDTTYTNFTDQGLAPGTYYYRVKAKNSTSESDYSNIVTLTVDNPTPPPPANRFYVFWPTGGTNVEVDWVRGDIDLSGNMVQLFRKDTVSDYWMPVKTISEEEKDSFIWHDDNVTASLNYKYQIRRFDMSTWEWVVAAESDWAALERPYPAPSGLEIINSTDDSATVSWQPIEGAGSYQVDISTDGGNTWQSSTISTTSKTVPKPCLFRVKAGTHARSQWSGILSVQ